MEPVKIELLMIDKLSGGIERAGIKVDNLRDKVGNANGTIESLNRSGISLGQTFGSLASAFAAKELIAKIASVRSEIKSLEISFNTLLGSEQKGTGMLGQLREFAVNTPMMLGDLAKGAQTMLGFGIEAEKIMPILRAIGDISMGDAQSFSSLSLAFSQMSATGKLMGQDLMQMINAGFNPLSEISRKTGKSVGELKDEMEKGAISVDMVTEAFISATSEGGKFYGMLENQSKSAKGAISNLQGAIDDMFNDMGAAVEDSVADVANAGASMVKHYGAVGEAIAVVVGACGVYRTALIVNTAVEIGAVGRAIVLTKAKNMLAAAIMRVNAALALNPWAAAAAAVAAMGYAVYRLSTLETEAAAATRKLDEATANLNKETATEDARISSMFAQLKAAKKGTDEYKTAKDAILAQYGGYLKGLSSEVSSLGNVEAAYRAVTKAAHEAARARAMETFSKEANDEYISKEGDLRIRLQKLMAKKYGNAKGRDGIFLRDTRYNEIMNSLKNGKSVNSGYLKQFDAYVSHSMGNTGGTYTTVVNELRDIINEYNTANKTLKDVMDEAQTRFGSLPEKEDAAKAKTQAEYNKKDWEEYKKAKQAEYDAMTKAQRESGKGRKLAQEILRADKEINAYNVKHEQSEANKAAKLEERQEETMLRLGQEMAQLQQQNDAMEIDAMEEGTEKKLRQIENDYEKQKNAIAKLEADWKKENKKAGRSANLTDEQQAEIDKANALNDQLRKKRTDDVYKEEAQAMRDYLKEYGTYQQQKLAIAEEYAEKIRKAQTDGARKTLEKELEAALADLDMEELKKGIDWEEVFGDLDKVSTEGLRTLRERLREYIETQKGLQPDGLKELVSAIGAIDEKVKERNPFDALRTSLLELQGVTDKVKLAQDIYNKTLKEGTKEEQKNAKATLDAARNARQKALAEATDAMHKTVGKVREYADAGEALTGLTDSLGIKKPEWLEDYLEGTGQMLDGLESIDLTKPMSVVTGGIKALSGAVRQLTSLGGVINWNGSNAKEVQATIERLTERNEILTDSRDRLTDELGKTGGMKAVSTAKKADEQQREKERNLLEMMEAQMGYHGSHHSWNYYWGGFSQKQIADFSEQIGRAWDGALTSLSADEAARLLENPDMVEAIKNAGKGGYGSSVLEKLKDYAAEAGALQEIEKQLNESLTQTSFDSLRDDFISSLSDMEKSAEDFSDDFTKMLMQSVLNAKIADLMDDELEKFYQDWAERSKDGLSAGDIDALKAQWDDIVQAGMAIRDEVAGVTGYTGSAGGGKGQSGKSGGFSAMSQDQGTKLEGMFTSGLRHWASMDERMENVAEKMNTAEGYLARIEENTGKSAGHLETLVESFLKMVRDGLKVR